MVRAFHFDTSVFQFFRSQLDAGNTREVPVLKDSVHELAQLIRSNHEWLMQQWRSRVRELPVARDLDIPTLNDHLSDLVVELTEELDERSEQTLIETPPDHNHLRMNPVIHGLQRLRIGFDLEEVVAEYNALRNVIQQLADERGGGLNSRSNHIVNRVIDGAIGVAVKSYAMRMNQEAQERREQNLAFLVHDIRSPLAAVATAAHLLQMREKFVDQTSAELVDCVLRNTAKLDHIIVNVLQQSEPAGPREHLVRKTTVKLHPLVSALLDDLQPLAQTAGTQLANQVDITLDVQADAHRLMLILQNLIGNALRHAPGGTVSVGGRALEDGSRQVWVQDQGPGISAEQRAKVFETYEKAAAGGDGFGLGLAIVRKLVEAHRGLVDLVSEPGKGCRFVVTLPA